MTLKGRAYWAEPRGKMRGFFLQPFRKRKMVIVLARVHVRPESMSRARNAATRLGEFVAYQIEVARLLFLERRRQAGN